MRTNSSCKAYEKLGRTISLHKTTPIGSVSDPETEGGLSQFMDSPLVEQNQDEKEELQEDHDYFSAVEDDVYKDEGWGLW